MYTRRPGQADDQRQPPAIDGEIAPGTPLASVWYGNRRGIVYSLSTMSPRVVWIETVARGKIRPGGSPGRCGDLLVAGHVAIGRRSLARLPDFLADGQAYFYALVESMLAIIPILTKYQEK